MYASLRQVVSCDIVSDASRSATASMDAPTIQPKFLPKRDELGLVAVGFSGGQVRRALNVDEMV